MSWSHARPATLAIAVIALSAAPRARLAAQDAARALQVADAVRLAGARHPAIVAASARRQSAVGLARQEATFANPVVEWRRENVGGPPGSEEFITVLQPIDVTGRRFALRAGTAAVDRRARADSVTVARAVELDAARAFWRASLATALLGIASEQRRDADRLASTEARRAREGAVAESWAMRAELEAERARLAEAGARAEWARARAELSRAIAVPIDSIGECAVLPPSAAPPGEAPTMAAALARARTDRSELAAARAQQDVARRRTDAARRGALGDLSLLAGSKRTLGNTSQVFGVALPLPFLDRNAGARDAAAGERRLAEADARAVAAAIDADVAAAVESYRVLLDARGAGAPAMAARAADVARIAESAYGAGGATLLELLDARRARAEALAALLRWNVELRLARLDLARATGAPILEGTP